MRRLAADANTLITAAHEENGRLIMPEQLANERFNLADSDLIGMIYSSEGELLWQSRSSADRLPDYDPTYRHDTLDFSRTSYRGEEYFVYDLDRKSTRLNSSHVAISYAVFCFNKKRIIR